MKEKWLQANRAEKIRLIILFLIGLWCAYCVIAYSYEVYHLDISGKSINTKRIGPVFIDGSDFTDIFSFLGGEASFLFALIVVVCYSIITAVLCLPLQFLFWFLAIRKRTQISTQESELSQNVFGFCGVFSLIGGVVASGFHSYFPAVWLTCVWFIPSFLIVVIPLRRRTTGINTEV